MSDLSHRSAKVTPTASGVPASAKRIALFHSAINLGDTMVNFVNPAKQAMNLIRKIGDEVSQSGQPIAHFAISDEFTIQLMDELIENGIIKVQRRGWSSEQKLYFNVNLTLEGWDQFEQERRGKFKGNYGFIAMQFNDSKLDSFVLNTIKPAIKNEFGFDLVDMRDTARAGVIDNNMRVEIRDADFVIADLTHDNHGAYWESGYAEGLGKPVIYICEQTKFDRDGTHFDTNHCTTITWSENDPDGFVRELIATIRRSLPRSL